jgi:integrase/recombinase XerD
MPSLVKDAGLAIGVGMPLAVQRLRLPGTGRVSWTLLGDDALPVGPAEEYLAYLQVSASPNTVQAYAHDLRDFFTWAGQAGLDWRAVSLEQVSYFFDWLRRPPAARAPGVFMLPGAGQAVENSTLLRKRAALAGFYRFHARRDPRVPAVLGELIGTRPTGSYIPVLAHTVRAVADAFSPLRITAPRKVPNVLSPEQAGLVMAACSRARDRFLVGLPDEAGLRIGEALGLRHEDLSLRRAEVRVVPREDNSNQARVKRMKERAVPVRDVVLDLYADYMELEYGMLDCDYVLVTLSGRTRGAPMTRHGAGKLFSRLRQRTGIGHLHAHAYRHTYATRLLRAGVAAPVVAELLGHSSSQTTAETYSHLTAEDHRKVLAASGLLDAGRPGCEKRAAQRKPRRFRAAGSPHKETQPVASPQTSRLPHDPSASR